MIKGSEIITLQDAYHLVWYMSVEINQESVYDSLPWGNFSISEFASILTEAGIISRPLADKYIAKFGGDAASDMWKAKSDQFRYLTNSRIDWGDERSWANNYENTVEPYQALFAAATVLCNKEYRRAIFDDLEQYIEEYSDEEWFIEPDLIDIESRTSGRSCFELPALPIHHK